LNRCDFAVMALMTEELHKAPYKGGGLN
jgi:hypothetical protein